MRSFKLTGRKTMASSLKFAIAVLLLLAYLYARLQHGWHPEESREAQMVRLGSKVVASDLLKRGRLWRDVTGGGERQRHNSLTNRPHWFLDSLLLLAGDIELNPGPKGKRLLEAESSSSSKRVKFDVKSPGSKSDDVEVRSAAAPRSNRYQKAEPVTQRKIITPIGSLNPITRGWTIKARVLSEPNLTDWENDMKAGKVVNFYLADKTGDIKVYAYNEVAEELYSRLKAGMVYLISGGSIKPANKKYTNIEFEILLNKTTKIETCQNHPDIPEVFNTYSFTDIQDVLESEPGSIIDVIGICEGSSGLTSTQNKTGDMIKQRVIRLRDKSGYIDCSLYKSNAKDFDSSSNPVVAIKAGKVTGNASIDTGPSSAVQINPSLHKSKELKDWYCDENAVSTTPDYMQLYYQTLAAETKVRLGVVQCMVVGPPQVGKTKLKKRLVGEDCSADDPSTGVADKPYVVVHTVHMSGTKWIPLQFDMEKKIFLHRLTCFQANINEPRGNVHRQSRQETEGIETQPSTSKTKRPAGPELTNDGVDSGVVETTDDTATVPTMVFFEALLEDTEKAKALAAKDIENGCMIYFTDTGGQLEFQEVLPSIISGPAIFMIVFSLEQAATSEGLSKKFEVNYKSSDGTLYSWHDDNFVPKMSTKELIIQSLVSICSTRHKHPLTDKEMTPKAMLIGTHLDKVNSANVLSINCELKRMLEPTDFHLKDILVYPSEDEFFFKVNNMDVHDPTFEDIRREIASISQIGEEYSDYVESVPFSWLAFDFKLRMSERQLLTISECTQMAKTCGVKPVDVKHIMDFLQKRFGCIRYFSHLDMVVTNPQIIYDSITHLVVETFGKKSYSGGPTRGESKMFKEKGLIPVKALRRLHNKKVLIPFDKLLILLKHLHIVAAIETDDDIEETYFMPCILAHAPLANNDQRNVNEVIAKLVIAFKFERCPKGFFSVLLATLADQSDDGGYKWKLKCHDHSECVTLYRDQVSFEIYKPTEECSFTVYISVVDCNYITISIDPSDQELCVKSTACNDVFRRIRHSLKSVYGTLNYKDSEYYFAFHCEKKHLAEVRGVCPTQMFCAKCKSNKDLSKYPLCDKHAHWFRTTEGPALQSSATGLSKMLSDPTAHDVIFSRTFWGIPIQEYESTLQNKTPTIAILDTGINQMHPAFQHPQYGSKFVSHRSYIEDKSINDVDGHGTACAGIAAGFSVYDHGQCVFSGGIASNANLIVCRIAKTIDQIEHSLVARALSDIIKLNKDKKQELGLHHIEGVPAVDVVSMSFFLNEGIENQVSQLLLTLRTQGTICVAAAGNSGNWEHTKYPACLGHVISVGSHTIGGKLSDFSRDGADVYALGEKVYVPTILGSQFLIQVSQNGTSMAAPAVAGLIALLIECTYKAFDGETNDEIHIRKWIHNSDNVLKYILQLLPMHQDKYGLHPKKFFERFTDNIVDAVRGCR